MTTIAADAMGGAHAPAIPVEGALLAARAHNVSLLLVGQPEPIKKELKKLDTAGLKLEIVPTRAAITSGAPSVLVDVGANIDCRPQHLVQFAVMGEVYYRVMFGKKRPRVGLLS